MNVYQHFKHLLSDLDEICIGIMYEILCRICEFRGKLLLEGRTLVMGRKRSYVNSCAVRLYGI